MGETTKGKVSIKNKTSPVGRGRNRFRTCILLLEIASGEEINCLNFSSAVTPRQRDPDVNGLLCFNPGSFRWGVRR